MAWLGWALMGIRISLYWGVFIVLSNEWVHYKVGRRVKGCKEAVVENLEGRESVNELTSFGTEALAMHVRRGRSALVSQVVHAEQLHAIESAIMSSPHDQSPKEAFSDTSSISWRCSRPVSAVRPCRLWGSVTLMTI